MSNIPSPEQKPPQKLIKPFSAAVMLRNSPFAVVLCVIILLTQLGGSDASVWLRYDRSGILSGEVWRLITGHLIHLGWSHLLMNMIGLLLIWLLFGHLIRVRSWLLICTFSAIGVSGGMLLFNSELKWYVGLSGVLHGMFVAGAVVSVRAGYRAELLLLLGLVAKLGWEQVVGPLPGSAEFAGGNVIVDAHLYGAISGFLLVGVLLFFAGRKPGSTTLE